MNMSGYQTGSWQRPPSSRIRADEDLEFGERAVRNTWNGPISSNIYGHGLQDLCSRTKDNLVRITKQMKNLDPCMEYGIKHWHPNQRPPSAPARVERPKTKGKWENLDVMFTDRESFNDMGTEIRDDESYIEPTVPVNRFCYLCSTLEEHKRHMLQHRAAKRPSSGKPRIVYIAPKPKVKRKTDDDDDAILVKERLYKVEMFTSDLVNAGTTANVFITIKGSLDVLPRTKLQKNRGCSSMCFVRASKEVFHVQGPNLGNLQILTVEHDGKERKQGWHLDRVEITDVKGLKTWMFKCASWVSMYEKPHYSNKVDLRAEDKHTPPTDYQIEVYTGKSKFAGTDSNVYLTIHGEQGSSKKIHLVDPTSGKKLFERKSLDNFRIRINGVGEIKRIRIEHDGKGLAAGWFLDQIVIYDVENPKFKYYCKYGGWIAADQGDGLLWREIRASKGLPKELHKGDTTTYQITVKTGDVRYAGTDADVFIQVKGPKGITPKLKLDDAKNNFEKDMTDQFNLEAVNVGPLQHIIIGHDNSGPGAGWFLDNVQIRRYLPKAEVVERMRLIKRRLKQQQKKKRSAVADDDEDEMTDNTIAKQRRRSTERKQSKTKQKKQRRTGSSSSSSESSSDDEDKLTGSRRKSVQDRHGNRDVRGSRLSLRSQGSTRSGRSSRSAADDRRKRMYEEDEEVEELRIPHYEEYTFPCKRWLADNEDDSLCVRELSVDKKVTYFKD